MPRHSKNNCARPIFTHWEKHNTHEYGTRERRLTHDSQKRFEACSLCLQAAAVPLADPQGTLYYLYIALGRQATVLRACERAASGRPWLALAALFAPVFCYYIKTNRRLSIIVGHIYCKQCVYEYILDQKKQYALKKREYEEYKNREKARTIS